MSGLLCPDAYSNGATSYYVKKTDNVASTWSQYPATQAVSMANFKINNLAAPVAGTDAASKTYVDTAVSTWSQNPATQLVSMANFKIINLSNPAAAQDAATKAYVDNAVSGADSSVNNFYTYNTPGNQRNLVVPLPSNVNILNLTAGLYQFNAYFNNIVPDVSTTNLDMYFVPTGSPSAIIPFSQSRLTRTLIASGAGSYNSCVSGTFAVETSGSYTFIFATDGNSSPTNTWTSDIWNLQLVKLT
jgi:hypothetical protein